ncbi:MAG: hypothetical protein M1817_001876 [Caeruleum heppii]|nr:MAG: hypothetical protein M1817_001876 [Caeruleum heppii]
MPRRRMGLVLAALAFALPWGSSFKLDFYQGGKCRSANIGESVIGPDAGCQTQWAGTAASVMVESTGPIDDPFYVVLFSSDDCNPDTVIGRTDTGCLAADAAPINYKSFEVWNTCPNDQPACLDS